MKRVHNYGITYRCYRFKGIFNNANGLAVRYTIMKDMMYLIALNMHTGAYSTTSVPRCDHSTPAAPSWIKAHA